jgi:hypothetical protein
MRLPGPRPLINGDIVMEGGRPVFYASVTEAQLGALAEALLR